MTFWPLTFLTLKNNLTRSSVIMKNIGTRISKYFSTNIFHYDTTLGYS